MPAEIKVVPVGDGAVGKTAYNFHIHYHDSILKNFHSIHAAFGGEYPESLLRVADNWQGSYISNNLQCSLSVWDTSGADGHARIRAMSYPNTDVFLVLFSVVDGISFINSNKDGFLKYVRLCLLLLRCLLGQKMICETLVKGKSPKNVQKTWFRNLGCSDTWSALQSMERAFVKF